MIETKTRLVEEPQAQFVKRRPKVWLECAREMCDLHAVRARDHGFVVDEVRLIDFICPRCGKEHQSLLFP